MQIFYALFENHLTSNHERWLVVFKSAKEVRIKPCRCRPNKTSST